MRNSAERYCRTSNRKFSLIYISLTGELTGSDFTKTAGFVVLYSITILVALSGNLLLIFIIKRRPETRSLTGFFFVNMAVSDLFVTLTVMLVSMSFFFTKGKWLPGDLGHVTCTAVYYLNFVTIAASISSLLLISVDRYLGVAFPLRRFPKFRRVKVLTVAIWLSAIVVSIPAAIVWKIFKYMPMDTSFICGASFEKLDRRVFFTYVFLLLYLVPLLVITTLYTLIFHALYRRHVPGLTSSEAQHRNELTKRKVVRMLVIITAVFAICWLPSHVYNFILAFRPDIHNFELPIYVQYFCFWLGHANSAINPWLYMTLSESFRKALCTAMHGSRYSRTFYKSARSQASTKYTSVRHTHNGLTMPEVSRKQRNGLPNKKEEQICRETDV